MRGDEKRPYYKPMALPPREPTSVLQIVCAILGGLGMGILYIAALAAFR